MGEEGSSGAIASRLNFLQENVQNLQFFFKRLSRTQVCGEVVVAEISECGAFVTSILAGCETSFPRAFSLSLPLPLSFSLSLSLSLSRGALYNEVASSTC